jgi:monomeric isocitrate dehydrogenase
MCARWARAAQGCKIPDYPENARSDEEKAIRARYAKCIGSAVNPVDVKAVMPESAFARIYQEMINFCKWHRAFDPRTMGTVPNVGPTAWQAEEYGLHAKTFEIPKMASPISLTSPAARCS